MGNIVKIIKWNNDDVHTLSLNPEQVKLWDFLVENGWGDDYWEEIEIDCNFDFGGD